MDDFFNNINNNNEEENAAKVNAAPEMQEPEIQPEPFTAESEDNFEQAADDGGFADVNTENSEPIGQNQYAAVYNPINYSPVMPADDYKPMSKGLKVFAIIMAAVILLTGSCLTGYILGRESVSFGKNNTKVDLAAAPADTDEMTPAEVYEKVNESVVGIMVYNSLGQAGQASGIVFSKEGYIITNDHIYAEIASAKFKIYMHDGTEYDAQYVAGDSISDLAVLKISANNLKPATFGNSDELYHGQNVVAIGRPSDATDHSSITKGIISAVSRRVQSTSSYSARLIQTDSAINPGSSGGALVNMYGQVVGVTSAKLASSDYDNVGYAIPTTIMKRIVDELISEGKVVSRARLGITYMAIDSVTAEIKGYDNVGLLIDSVTTDSGLYGKAEKGDIITHINNIAITNDTIVLDIIEQSKAGDKISVTIVNSKGATKTVEAELKANVSESSYTTINSNNQNGGFGSNDGTFDFPEGE